MPNLVSNDERRARRPPGTWWVRDDVADLMLGPGGPPVARWRADGLLEPVKAGRHRRVDRLRLGDREFYLKQDGPGGLRGRARHLLGPRRAFREVTAADRVRAAGVDTITPVLAGRTPFGFGLLRAAGPRSVLVTEAIPDTAPLTDWLAAPGHPAADRRAVLAAVAELVAKLHAAGLFPGDLHPGNLLLRWDSPGGNRTPRLWLIDLHPLAVRRPTARRVTETLVMLAHGTFAAVTPAERRRFVAVHRDLLAELRPDLSRCGPTGTAWVRRLETVRRVDAARRHARRDRVWRRGCTGQIILDDARGVTALGRDQLTALAHRAARPGFPTCVNLAGVRTPVRAVRDTPAAVRRGWEAGHALLRRGLPVAEPLLCVERPGSSLLLLAAADPVRPDARAVEHALTRLFAAGYTLDAPTASDFAIRPSDGRVVLADPGRVRERRRADRAVPTCAASPIVQRRAA